MKARLTLKELFSIFPTIIMDQRASLPPFLDREVSSVCFDSRRLETGCVFVAIRGEKTDGHRYLADAASMGAIALVVEDVSLVPADFNGLVFATPSSRKVLNQLAAKFFGEPARELKCIGVTGTNGKTTTTYMIEAILNHAGVLTGVIGTINHHLGAHVWETEMTTPDPIAFQKRLREFCDLGARAVALEVSSHALRQSRVDEVPFDVAVFTNLSRDHLDYHHDMDDYFDAKHKLFRDLLARSDKKNRFAVINGEDTFGRKIETPEAATRWTYGSRADASLRFEVLEQGFGGTRFRLYLPGRRGDEVFHVRMPGLHNVENACAAIGAALAIGATPAQCREALAAFNGVKGRLEAVPNKKGVHVFVDYAHTDGAIETVLHYLGNIRKAASVGTRIITVFGCGGDRDRGKRPLMMKAALGGSDLVVLTSDNPRTEEPEAILRDALAGVDPTLINHRVFHEVDRRLGIAHALKLAHPGDVVLIAGKGHEDYQQIGTQKFPFSDVRVVEEILK